MAIETLKDVDVIGGFEIGHCEDGTDIETNFIHIDDKLNAIAFKIQNGPIKENGVNGCQIDTIIETSKIILEKLNEKYPCFENQMAISHLVQCLMWLNARTENREKRGVEGKNEN